MMASTEGYWVGKGTPSQVDWCEPNYVVTPYVAEFWNTLSSVPMVVIGLYGMWRAARAVWCERRFLVAWFGLAVVGVGSAGFHGTLLRGPQALDELPMVYLGLLGAWLVRFRDRPVGEGRGEALAMVLYAAGFTMAYAMTESYFAVFLVTYSLLVAYVTIRSITLAWVRPAPKLLARLLLAAAIGFMGGLLFFWIPEHVLLGCDHPLQALQLHSFWHLGAGFGTYVWFLFCLADRKRLDGRVGLAGAFVTFEADAE